MSAASVLSMRPAIEQAETVTIPKTHFNEIQTAFYALESFENILRESGNRWYCDCGSTLRPIIEKLSAVMCEI